MTGRPRGGALFLTLMAYLAIGIPASGQELPDPDSALEDRALEFAQAWVNSDLDDMERLMEPSGVRLQLQGGQKLFVAPARARAAISTFMQRYEGGEAELFRVARVGDDPDAGFADFRWAAQVSGLRSPVIFSLFLAFRRTDPGWVVTEIRLTS